MATELLYWWAKVHIYNKTYNIYSYFYTVYLIMRKKLHTTIKKYSLLIQFIIGISLVIGVVTCRNDDSLDFVEPSAPLTFSRDTVLCDTVYAQTRSETYAVKVYNKEDKDILIPKIALEKAERSLYKINVDGKPGIEFRNVPLRRKDSLYIFVEIAPTASGPEFIAEDNIVFSSAAHIQKVKLLSVVQDAQYFIQTGTQPLLLANNSNWDNQKVKVLYGDVRVPSAGSLNITQGTKIYFHKNAKLTLNSGATLNATGNLQQPVLFRGERNDSAYDSIPKNYDGIYLEKNATANLNYTKIMGGTVGISSKEATINMKNSWIFLQEEFGIQAVAGKTYLDNVVMNYCGKACVGIFAGGTLQSRHSSLGNNWNYNPTLPGRALWVSNQNLGITPVTQAITIYNSILWNDNNAVIIETGATAFPLFQNCLIKFDPNIAGYSNLGSSFQNCLFNLDPKFISTKASALNMRIANNSPAKAKANPTISQQVASDILGISRLSNPSIGAYQ